MRGFLFWMIFLIGGVRGWGVEEMVLPVRFHLTQGASLTVKGVKMEVWVKPEDVRTVLLAEINRIWKPAGIRFEVEKVIEESLLSPANREKIFEQIAGFQRGDAGGGGGSPFALAGSLFRPEEVNPQVINVYFFPYIGQTLQGVATLGGRRVLVGVWSDKASHGKRAPEKTLLTEAEPMVRGSLGRTLGHELGHALTLVHPPKDGVDEGGMGRLMGGGKQGYGLTAGEIEQARRSAIEHLRGRGKSGGN